MKTFTIENETNDITVYASATRSRGAANSERFTSEDELATLAAEWPTARLVEIWNSLPGETPVKKFKDRATAVSRIWKAIQSLGEAPAAVESEPVAEETAPARRASRSGSGLGGSGQRNSSAAKRSFRKPRRPPLIRPLRHKRPTSRRRRLPRRTGPPARRKRPSRSLPRMPARRARAARPAR